MAAPDEPGLTALIEAGLRIEFFHEFPFTSYPQVPSLMVPASEQSWRLKPPYDGSLPLLNSIKARKAE